MWQSLRKASLALLCIAGFMSGERSAFVAIPGVLLTFHQLRKGAVGVIWAGLLIASLLGFMLSISQVDPTGLLHMETELTQGYAVSQAGVLGDALRLTWLGRGLGTSTGAARVVSDDPEEFPDFESYYAKAVAELGLLGFALVVSLQLFFWFWAVRILRWSTGTAEESYAAALAACVAVVFILNYKGALLDLDPVNMLYWLFAGVLFSLPTICAGNVHRRFVRDVHG